MNALSLFGAEDTSLGRRLPVREAAQVLDLSERSIRRYLRAGVYRGRLVKGRTQVWMSVGTAQVETDSTGTNGIALPVYRRITAALRQSPALPLSLSAIFAVGTGDLVVHALGRRGAALGEFDATITFANYAPYAPYLLEGQASLRVHVYRMAPSEDTAACIDTAPVARDDRPEAGGG